MVIKCRVDFFLYNIKIVSVCLADSDYGGREIFTLEYLRALVEREGWNRHILLLLVIVCTSYFKIDELTFNKRVHHTVIIESILIYN